MLTARMGRVSRDSRRRRAGAATGAASCSRCGGVCGFASAIAVAIADAIKSFDLAKARIDRLELLPQPLDMAVDGAVVHVNVLAIGAVHELIAALDMPGPKRQRLQDQEFGDGEVDIGVFPTALVARGVEHQLAALNHRLALPAALRHLPAAQPAADGVG